MEVEKLRNLTEAELAHQERELNDQLFRMKFQLKMGQTESLNKIHGLRKDVARIKTILREKELGLATGSRKTAVASETAAAEPAAATAAASPAKPARTPKSAAARKTAAAKKTSASAKAKKKAAGAKAKARKS
ncbi:MAG TPA: 50S ribosomal protein L29 [Candidatus Angelobacter sp.]|nr:50S ribosomal protein L29 [Candidatus Angelobacter sp.]